MTIIDELNFEYTGEKEEHQQRVSEVATANNNLCQLQSLYDSLIQEVDSLWSPSLLRSEDFSPRDFELLLGVLWDWKGYDTYVTPRTDDGGVDIISREKRRSTFIEAKNTGVSNNVGVREVRNLYAAASNPNSLEYDILEDIDTVAEIIIITTSDLTSQAASFLTSVSKSSSFEVTVMRGDEIVYTLNKSELARNNWRNNLSG